MLHLYHTLEIRVHNVLLMYHSILGEWNLVNKYTGSFFSNLESLIIQIQGISKLF